MNQRFLSVLVFAFLMAAGASFLLYRLMAGRSVTKAAPPTTKVVLAARNLEVGTLIREADIKLGDWTGSLPAGATSDRKEVIGRGVVATIYGNEPVMDSRLAAKGAGGGLAAMIPKGMRAVAVRVNEVVGVAGFVLPGMRVDVLISGKLPGQGNNEGEVTKTLLQNIEVLSAGHEYKKDTEGKPVVAQVVNLLVTPDQAEMLSLAAHQTTIQLVLRNPLDTQVSNTSGTALPELFTGVKTRISATAARPAPARAHSAPQPVAAPPAPFVMEVINGNKKTEAKFAVSGEAR